MRRFAVCLLLAAPGAPIAASAQAGGFVLGRGVAVEGAGNATTGQGAIDTGAVTTEEAVLLEGRERGLEWRVRGQFVGRPSDFPGRASVSIKALSYGRALTDTVSVSVGKQQRVWGAGVAYQPLGFFRTQVNLRDPTDAEGRGEGVPMLYLARLGDPVTIEALVADDWGMRRGAQWAVRASTLIGTVEATALVRQRAGARAGAGGSATWAGTRLSVYGDLWWGPPERRRTVSDRAVAGVDTELVPLPGRGQRISYALGTTWTPVDDLALTAELDRRGEGLDDTTWTRFVEALRAAATDVTSPRAPQAFRRLAAGIALLSSGGARRDYLFGRAAFSRRGFGASVNLTLGLADRGTATTIVASHAVAPRWSVLLAATRFAGRGSSEYGLSPVRSVVSLALRKGFDL